MGYDYYGELGDGIFATNSPNGTNQPEEIVASNVTAIAAGEFHSLFLKSNGSLWGMGWNEFGQLGDGTTNNVNRPEMIYPSNVVAIAAGEGHSLFIKSDGSLWAMGNDSYGQLGDGIFATNAPYGTNQPEEIAPNNVTAISAGYLSSYFIESGGSLRAVGSDVYGELGDGVTYPTYNALNGTNVVEQVLGAYNQIFGVRLNNGSMQLSFEGLAGTNYALDRCFSLSPPNWIPQATNPASSFGALVFTNTPGAGTNNFWRIRLVR